MVLDAVGNPQTILLLGGTSEIGLAICERYLRNAPARIVLTALPDDALLIKVDRFALTANNITYAVLGDQLKYWTPRVIRKSLTPPSKME